MSWDQEYSVESYLELLVELTGKHPEELLELYLSWTKGIRIDKKEEVVLDDGFFGPVKGTKVTLSDGRVFIPKLTQKFNENGNHGIDTYEYCLESETPNVVYVGLDTASDDELASAEADSQSCTCSGIDHCHCDSDRYCTPECHKELGYKPNTLDSDSEELLGGFDSSCDDAGCGCGW